MCVYRVDADRRVNTHKLLLAFGNRLEYYPKTVIPLDASSLKKIASSAAVIHFLGL